MTESACKLVSRCEKSGIDLPDGPMEDRRGLPSMRGLDSDQVRTIEMINGGSSRTFFVTGREGDEKERDRSLQVCLNGIQLRSLFHLVARR